MTGLRSTGLESWPTRWDASSGDHGNFTAYPGTQMSGVALAPGTYEGPGLGSYSTGGALTHQYMSDDSIPPLTVSLAEADSSRVQGDISGVILLDSAPIDGQNISVANVQATFKITPNRTEDPAPGVTTFHCAWPE